MLKPAVTVVIPVHNKEPHIERCIGSVLAQSYTDFEVVIVDDASTDGSLEVVRKVKDARIRILARSTPGPGGYAARNLGILSAKGKWISFLDADDEWSTDHLERTHALMAEFPDAEVLSCGWVIHESELVRTFDRYYAVNAAKGDHQFGLRAFISGPRPVWSSVCTVSRRRLLEVGGFDEGWRHGGDTALWLKLLLAGCKGAWYAGLGATYYRDSTNMVTRNLTQTESPAARLVQAHLLSNPSDPLRSELRRYSDRMMTKPTLRLAASGALSPSDVADRYFFAKRRSRVMSILAHLPRAAQRSIARTLLARYD